jgi:hypothetical protein
VLRYGHIWPLVICDHAWSLEVMDTALGKGIQISNLILEKNREQKSVLHESRAFIV